MDTTDLNLLERREARGLIARTRDWLRSSPRRVPLLYLAFLTLAEAVTTLVEPRVGMVLHGVCLVSLILHAALFSVSRERLFLMGLSMAPMIRMLSLTLPLPRFPYVYWYLVVGAPLFLAAFILIRIAGLGRQTIGLTARAPIIQVLVGLTGLSLGYLEYLILRPAPLVAEFRLDLLWVPALILLVFTGFLEEVIFRGILQHFSIRNFGRWGLFYVSVVFAVLHIGYQSVLDVVFVFLVAVYFSYVAQKTGSILGVTLAHGITNIALFLVFPFIATSPTLPDLIPDLPEIPRIFRQPAVSTPIVPLYGPGNDSPDRNMEMPFFFPATRTPLPEESATATPVPPTSTPAVQNSPTAQPTATQTSKACGPPAGWVVYIVQPGDTLFSLSVTFGVSVDELREANCLDSSGFIWVGQQLYVPFSLNQTPIPSNTLEPTNTTAPSNTPTPTPTPVDTGTFTPSPTLSPTLGQPPTDTPTPTSTTTPTAIPTYTYTPSFTPSPTHTLRPTDTPSPTIAPPPTDTPGG